VMSLKKKHLSGNMEQGLSFIGLITLCMVMVFLDSPGWFLVTFVGGVTYIGIRGKKKGWKWPNRY
jgi:hypothetical protein